MTTQIPITESRNPATTHIDTLSTTGMLRLINVEDMRVPQVVADEIDHIAQAVDAIHERMKQGGRLIYVGAGTSGRLGVVDASEMPPTYNVPGDLVIGVMAGGPSAMFNSAEDVEDNVELGRSEMARLNVDARDSVLGIAASGRTPFVIGALNEARDRGALTVSMACTSPAAMHAAAAINISLLTGAEVVTGSTRMKAGTATKLALNMISTTVMIKLGKTYGNLMVDLRPSNSKLRDRALRIIIAATGVSSEEAQRLIETCGDVKTSIVVALMGCPVEEARNRLKQAGGRVAEALNVM
jgi:N-acetylmuramic acid 6-phosphate etherase